LQEKSPSRLQFHRTPLRQRAGSRHQHVFLRQRSASRPQRRARRNSHSRHFQRHLEQSNSPRINASRHRLRRTRRPLRSRSPSRPQTHTKQKLRAPPTPLCPLFFFPPPRPSPSPPFFFPHTSPPPRSITPSTITAPSPPLLATFF